MSAHDALAYIDKAIDNVDDLDVTWRNDEVLQVLNDLRAEVVKDPEWAEVQESNLRAELARAREELSSEQMATSTAAALYEASLRHVEGERDRARATAVRLEQEVALAATGISRRAL